MTRLFISQWNFNSFEKQFLAPISLKYLNFVEALSSSNSTPVDVEHTFSLQQVRLGGNKRWLNTTLPIETRLFDFNTYIYGIMVHFHFIMVKTVKVLCFVLIYLIWACWCANKQLIYFLHSIVFYLFSQYCPAADRRPYLIFQSVYSFFCKYFWSSQEDIVTH